MQIASQKTANGYTLTASIPLSNFKENDWGVGKKILFDAAVSKAGKDGNREKKIFWNSLYEAYDNPSQWGMAEFK